MTSRCIVLVGSTACDCCGGGGLQLPRPRSVRIDKGRIAVLSDRAAKDHDAIRNSDESPTAGQQPLARGAPDRRADQLRRSLALLWLGQEAFGGAARPRS